MSYCISALSITAPGCGLTANSWAITKAEAFRFPSILHANWRQGNRLVVRGEDPPTDLSIPRGKQYWKPKSQASFIRARRVSGSRSGWKRQDHTISSTFTYRPERMAWRNFTGAFDSIPEQPLTLSIDVLDGTAAWVIRETQTTQDRVDAKISVVNPKFWSPDDPHLYTVRYKLQNGTQVLTR